MYDFLKMQYSMGRIDSHKLHKYVDAGRISEAEYQKILKGVV